MYALRMSVINKKLLTYLLNNFQERLFKNAF